MYGTALQRPAASLSSRSPPKPQSGLPERPRQAFDSLNPVKTDLLSVANYMILFKPVQNNTKTEGLICLLCVRRH